MEAPMQIAPRGTDNRYRCFLSHGQQADTGVLPFVQLRAVSAATAARLAHAVTGACVVEVVRLEKAAS
jgi:hypothetical protein